MFHFLAFLFYFILMVGGILELILNPTWPFTFNKNMPSWLASLYLVVVIIGIRYHLKKFIEDYENASTKIKENINTSQQSIELEEIPPPGPQILFGAQFILHATEKQVNKTNLTLRIKGVTSLILYKEIKTGSIYCKTINKFVKFNNEDIENYLSSISDINKSKISDLNRSQNTNLKIPCAKNILTYEQKN